MFGIGESAACFDTRFAGYLLHIFIKRKLTAADDNQPLPLGNIFLRESSCGATKHKE